MAHDPDVRWQQRFEKFKKAFAQLSKGVATAQQRQLSDLEQLGLIHTFEFTHELALGTLRDLLEAQGITNLYAPNNVVRAALARGLIEQGETWMVMIRDRSRSPQLFHRKVANEIAGAILPSYFGEFEKLLQRLEIEHHSPPEVNLP